MKNEGLLDEIRAALANDRDEAMRKRRVFRRRGFYKTETRDRALEHTRARIKAGITRRQIARDLGVNTSTLATWLTPAEREQTIKLRTCRACAPRPSSPSRARHCLP